MADLWQPVRAIRHNLPGERDAFVGRTRELHALAQRLESGSRVVTVLGPGGAGKTRFARRYASAWLGDWPGGVTFCDLSEARSLHGAGESPWRSALDVPLAQDDAVAQVGHAIAGRGRCLVVLDNFEHLVQHAEATLGRWAERAADAVVRRHQPRTAAPRRRGELSARAARRWTARPSTSSWRGRGRSGPTSR